MAGTVAEDRKRNAAYLLLWPGRETREFFNSAVLNRRVPEVEWCAGEGQDAGRNRVDSRRRASRFSGTSDAGSYLSLALWHWWKAPPS